MRNIMVALFVFAILSTVFGYFAADGASPFFIALMRHISFASIAAFVFLFLWDSDAALLPWAWIATLGAVLFVFERTPYAHYIPGLFADLGLQLVLVAGGVFCTVITLVFNRSPIRLDN